MQRELTDDEWKAWIDARPENVQKLAAEFIYGQKCDFIDGILYVVGWTETDGVLLSPINPFEDFDGSRKNYREWSAELLRKHSKISIQ